MPSPEGNKPPIKPNTLRLAPEQQVSRVKMPENQGENVPKPPSQEQGQSGEQEIDPYHSWNFLIETHDGTATLVWKSKSGKPERNPWQVIDRMLSIMNQETPPEGKLNYWTTLDIPDWPKAPFRFGVNKEELEKFIQEQEEKKPKDTPPEG